jgi:hypothetical protein
MAMNEVELEIRRLSRHLNEQTMAIGEAAKNAARSDVAYKRAYALAMIALRGHGGTVPEKEAEVTSRTIGEMEARALDEAVYRSLQEKGRNLRTQLEALRTVAANIRAAVDYSSGRGG